MNVENYIRKSLKNHKLHLTLLDPEEQTPEMAVSIAKEAVMGGSDGIMLGEQQQTLASWMQRLKLLKKASMCQ